MFRNVSFSPVSWYDPGFSLRRKANFSVNSCYTDRTFFSFTKPTSERDLMLKVFSEPISDSSSKTWKCPIRCFKQKCESFFRERLLFLDKLHFFLRKMMQTRNYWNRSEQTGNFTPWNWITEKPSKLRMILMLAAFLDNFPPNHTRLNMFILMRAFHWLCKSNEGVCTLRSFPRGFELYLLT